MKLESVEAKPLRIPFRTAFRHASAERAETQTVWVEARAHGETGYGEGCPREYVTDESFDTALEFCAARKQHWLADICDLESLQRWAARHAAQIDRNPAAWTAVELAVLDLLGKTQKRGVESLLGLPALAGRFRYTAVLGDADADAFAAQLRTYAHAGFQDFKVKLSGDAIRDAVKVRCLRAAGIAPDAVRADANNLWPDADAALSHLRALDYAFWALEEPLRAHDYAGMERVATALGAKIILDESFARIGELDSLAGREDVWLVNLRVSKIGGLTRSLDLVRELRERHMKIVIGAHVGETSLLTRAALTVAAAAGDILVAQEGAFGTHLLARDVVERPLMFGAGGVLDVQSAQLGPLGFGLDIKSTP